MAGNQITSFRNNVYTIYAQTNLDTSFALVVADEDTVQDAKHKAVTTHRICFPHIGDITVQSFKVKRKGLFFSLPDPMPVTSAFVGVKNTWYLYVDASCSPTRPTQNPLCLAAGANIQPEVLCVENDPLAEAERNKIDVGHISERFPSMGDAALLQGSGDLENKLPPVLRPNIVGCGMDNVESGKGKLLSNENHHPSTSDVDKRVESDLLEKYELANEQNEVLKTNPKSKREKSKKRKKDTLHDVSGEDLQLEPIAKKSRSTKATLEGDNPGICMANENASHLENVTQENSLEGIKATSYAKLDGGMPIKQIKDSKSAQRESEKDSLVLEEKVNSTLVPSRENARHENSKEQAANINDDLVKDAALTISSKQILENLGVTEREIQYRVVEEVGEGNSIPCPSLDESHAKPAVVEAVGDVDLDYPQDVDMGGAIGSELKSRVDTSEKTAAVGVSKRKKSKKDLTAITNEAERKVKDADSSNPLDASDIRETEAPGNKRRKKSKKPKSKDTDTRPPLHANNGDEKVTPFMPNHEKSFDGDQPAVEENNKGSIPSETKVQNAMVESHGPEIISEAANTVLATKDLDVPAASIEAVVVTEAQKDEEEKKAAPKKTRKSKLKKDSYVKPQEVIPEAGNGNGVREVTLQQPSLSTIDESPQAPSTVLNNVTVSRDEALEVPPNMPENGNHDVLTPTKELVQKKQEKELKLKKGRNIKAEVQNVMVESHGPEIISEAANTVLAIKESDVPAASVEAVFVTEVQDPSDKKKKKVRKTKASKAKKNVSSASAEDIEGARNPSATTENVEGTRGPVQLTSDSHKASVRYSSAETKEGDTTLSQTTVQDASKVEDTRTPAAQESRVEALEVPSILPENGNHEVLTPTKELVQKKQEKEPKLKKGRNTKAQVGDKVNLSLEDKYKAEAAAYKVSRRKTVDTSEIIKPQTLPITTPISTKVNKTGSQNRKSVLAAPKTIFSNSSTESSEDIEDTCKLDSDATVSPSDSSSSSDRSDLNPRGNESYERRKMEVSGISRKTGRKDLLTILSSSKSYKTAKLAASQSQPEDNETLPVQFHLDA